MSLNFCWKKKGMNVKVWRCAAVGSSLAVEFMLHQGNAEYLNKLASVLLEMQNLF